MKNFKTVILAAIFFVILQIGTASADSFDNLQAVLVSDKYTIRYENITPPARQATLKERTHIFDGKMYNADSFMMYKNVTGVISSDGVNRYVETAAVQNTGLLYASCSLRRGDEIFYFTRLEEKGKVKYIGKVEPKNQKDKAAVEGKVSAMKFNRSLSLENPTNLSDDAAVSKVLNAVLPNSEKSAGAITYRKIKTGTLKNGLEYTDLKAVNPPQGVIFDAIRYYFENGKLVKISAGQYFGVGADLDGIRTIIKVTDFQDSADRKLLQLPKELKDSTKRDKEKKA